jgi:valyl-tRNA synthetase
LISRQRFFGVPIPVWYQLDESGNPNYESPILPSDQALPIDPSSDVPSGFSEDQRGKPGGFIGELDIMDTWATSSLTPQLAGGWPSDEKRFKNVFPYDLRPQGQDIIRTWLFSTLLRSQLEHGGLPWKNAAISGWILDPDRKKMSKSKGNVVVPNELLENHGSDAVRYWAASARLGTDAAFDEGQMKIGRRLAIKLLNAARFALSFEMPQGVTEVTEEIDLSMLASLSDVVRTATDAFASYDHTKALETAESFFWTFTDDYLELVKDRAYGAQFSDQERGSAVLALRSALSVLVRLFAPFLPFASEEVWSWWQEGSVHQAAWPTVDELKGSTPNLIGLTSEALILIRKSKSDLKLSMKAEIAQLKLKAPSLMKSVAKDLQSVGNIAELELIESSEIEIVEVRFAEAQ